MADREMILLFITLVIQVTQVESQAQYKGCYKENLRSRHFKLSPGDYDPNTLKVEKCTELCGMYLETFGGLIAGRFCFCGPQLPDSSFKEVTDANCDSPCAGNTTQMCGGGMYLSVYQSSVSISKVELTVSPVVIQTFDEVAFTLEVESGSFMNYQMDYDDGNGVMQNNATGMLMKKYVMPGQFDPTVTASAVAGGVSPKSDNARVMVQARVKDVQVVCPLFITDDENFCIATITEGTRLLLTDEVDGNTKTIYVADPVIDAAGCCVPSTTDTPPNIPEIGVFMMPTSEFKYEGVITHWELWAEIQAGVPGTTLTVMVLKPTCADYCYHSNTCGGACSGTTCAGGNFCLRSLTCEAGCPAITDRHATLSVNYDVRETVTLTVVAGYQVVEAPDYIRVYPGDIIAYERTSTSASLTVSTGQTYSDYEYAAATTTFTSGGGTERTGIRHHIRAIYSSQTKVLLTYQFTSPGVFPLTTKVANLDFSWEETNVTQIEVLQGINATIIETSTYWITGVQNTFEILPHTGTSVKRNWVFGDGNTINDTTTMSYDHTYTARGTYIVQAISFNQLTSKSNMTTVIVEDRITGFSVTPTNCVTLTNCIFTINIATGSDYVISFDYNDGSTDAVLEADSGNGDGVNHVYTTGGTYTVTANCSNNVSSTAVTLTVQVQEECLGLALVRTGAEKLVDFRIEWTLTQGSDCVFDLNFNGDDIPFETADLVAKRWQTALQSGLVANIYPLTLAVSNAVGGYNISANFTIETAMKDVQTSCDLTQTGTGIPVSCSASMSEGSNVVCTWDFDDGTPPVTHNEGPSDWASRPDRTEIRQHTFTAGKLHNVRISCANNDRTETQTHPILVIVSVMDVELIHKDTIFFTPPGTGEFHFETSGGTPNAAKVEFKFGDSFEATDDLVMNQKYTHNYRDPSDDTGCYKIEARIWNAVSTKTFNDTEMCVIDPIENLKIITDPPGAVKNQPVTAKISMYRGPSGRFASISCNFDDGGAVQVWDRQGSDQDGEDTRPVTYTTAGVTRTIECTVSTPLENATGSYTLLVDEPVTNDCKIWTNYPVTHGNTIEYYVQCDTNPMPTNAYITIDPGDGEPEKKELFSEAAGVPQVITHIPKTDGHFVASISLANGGSSISDTLFAGSYIPLTTTTNVIQYKLDIPLDDPWKNGINGNNEEFPSASPITSNVSVGAGTPVYYVLTAVHSTSSPVVVCNKTASPFSCELSVPGVYTVTTQVFNPVQNSTPETLTITMREPVSNFHIKELTPNAKPGTVKKFEFTFDAIGENSCLNIDFDDGTDRTFTYGNFTYCKTTFADSIYSGVLDNPKTVTFKYDAPGNYEIKATILNSFSENHMSFKHSVSFQDCSKPSVEIEDAMTDFRNPLDFEKSKDIVIRGKSNISCTATLDNKKTWVVEAIDPNNGNSTAVITPAAFTSDKAELIAKARTFKYGLYKATYCIKMQLTDGTVFEECSFTFFEVTKSAIVVIVEIGDISEVDRGENAVVTFNPEQFSFDPDVDPDVDQGFATFTWGCTLLETNGSLTSACDPITGQTLRSLTFNTNQFKVGEKIQLSCTVTKDTRTATGKIVVNIIRGTPLNLYIQPTGSSLVTQLVDGIKISSEDRLAVGVKCKDCVEADMDCLWTAYSYEYRWPWREYFVNEVASHVVGMNSSIISITKTLYDIHPTVLKYRFSVQCRIGTGTPGKAAINVHLNRPPQPGVCTVDPKESTLSWGAQKTFNVKCSGWNDGDGIAMYKFYSKHKYNELYQQIQMYREAKDVYIDPPLGADYDNYQEELWCDVVDADGSTYSYKIDDIKVNPPAIDQIQRWSSDEKFLSSSDIDKLAASGEQKAVTEYFTQVLTLLNAERKHSEIEYQGLPGIGPSLSSTSFLAAGDNTVANAMDADAAAANKANSKELLDRYETERDNNALMRDQIADICSQMTCPNPTAVEQVLTCLHTVSAAPNECTRTCQLKTLKKTLEIAADLGNMKASAEKIKSIATTVLDVLMNAVIAGNVNKDYPTKTDVVKAKESAKYQIYDTDLQSKEPSVIDAEDPFKQHAKNVHAGEQDELMSCKEIGKMFLITDTRTSAAANSADITNIMRTVMGKLAQTLRPAETLEFTTPSVVGSVKHLEGGGVRGVSINLPLTDTAIVMPSSDIFGGKLGDKETAVVSALVTTKDVHTYAESADSLGPNSQFVTIDFLRDNGSVIPIHNTPEPIKIVIAQSSDAPPYDKSELYIANWNKFYYKTITVQGLDPSVHIDIKEFEDQDVQAMLIVYKGTSADIENGKCDDVAFLPHTLTAPRKTVYTMNNKKVNKYKGILTFGFRIMPKGFDTSTVSKCSDLEKFDFKQPSANLSLSVCSFISGCYFFDKAKDKWDSEGCTVGEETGVSSTTCFCNHLTTFGGGWVVAPNTIDWNFVFSNADFYKNPTLYITEIIIALIYIMAVVWARRNDKKDVERLGLTPLKDNDPRDKYYYEIVVATGMRRNAGTDSKVFIILSGEYDETDVRMLNDDKRKVFRRGNTDAFLMAVSEPLGAMNYVRVWHDNTGKGKFGSWYMKYMVVRDVQTEEKWVFICNRWFAVEEDDGQVDRVVPVAGLAQMTEFGHLFSERSKKNLVDGHLWFSVVARPPQSRFTRVQRVSCCLCLLYATMLGNAMFYGLVDSQSGTSFTFGPFALSPQQIYVGFLCNLIVFPANFIIITLFRKSKARKLRPSRLEEALKQMPNRTSASMTDVKPEVTGIWSTGTRPDSRGQPRAETSFSQNRPSSSMEDREGKKRKKKKKWELPWWCRILGWILLWAATLASAAFVTFYGIMFEDEKCKKWITSMLISFFTSIFVTQPVKVFLTAIFFSLVWRNPTDDDDDHPEDMEETKLSSDEEYLHAGESGFGAARPRKIGYKPPDPAALEKARQQRLNEIKMWDIIREIVFYSFFLWILMVISYRNRSPHGYYYKDTLEKMMIKNNDTSQTLHWFTKIQNTYDFWKWARSGMVNSVRASSYYNKDPPLLLRGFIGDKVSRMMGYATMRQLRVKPALCDPLPEISSVIPECNEPYSLFSESKDKYAPGWTSLAVNETARMEYSYRTASDLNGFPYWGLLEVYGGGGYVVELKGSREVLAAKMVTLENETWIDKYTRAIFVEFTVYNPQVNLFAIATILAEFQPSGGVLTSYRFEPAMLLPYMTSVMLFQIACEVIYFIFTIVFIVKEFRQFLKERTNYFKSFWNLIEISIITMSIASIVVYFYRLVITNALTNEFQRTHGNEYMKFQYAGYWNELFTYMIGWLVFFGTLKFLKLLRFNKRMSLLASTLKSGAHSILHFSLLFWILYLAFMQLFYLTFKNVSAAFTTFIMAAESGLLMMMGKFDIYGMLMVEPILTQVYVFFFVVTVTFILVNMFLSILNETFGSVRGDINKQNNDYEIVDFMVTRFKRWTGLGTTQQDEVPAPNGVPRNREPTVEEFPDRIDRLLNSISNVYMDDNLGALLDSKGESKKMAMKHMLRGPASGPSRVGPTRVHTH